MNLRSDLETKPTSLSRDQLVKRYQVVRNKTEELASPLSPEDQTVQSMPDASPTKWHRAHTTWFFETFVLLANSADYECFDKSFAFLFNSYYEAAGPRHTRAERGMLSRPSAETVTQYRKHVDTAMAEFLSQLSSSEIDALVELGLQHEKQHQELILMDVKHMLSQHPNLPAYRRRKHHQTLAPDPIAWLPVTGGAVLVGHTGGGFFFDNEGPAHETLIPDFEIGSRLVTAGEWLEFVVDGGYNEPRHWLSEGWATVKAQGWTAPEYWFDTDEGWQIFTLDGSRPLDPSEPVCHVSMFEADAYATWAGARLPTEFEWEVASNDVEFDGNLLDQGSLHPTPAVKGPDATQMFGDVWEWTSSGYLPYPGYQPEEGAVGEYNGKFMSNQSVLRGGSCLTPGEHIRHTYRNFFPAQSRWAMSGVRLARDAKASPRPIRIDRHLADGWSQAALEADVLAGLTAANKSLPPKWFYDERGSQLYDQITRLEEYYPTRREAEILREEALAIAALTKADTLVELGSGTSEKTRILLNALWANRRLRTYVPFDVSEEVLIDVSNVIAEEFPGLKVHSVVGDFEHHLSQIPTGIKTLFVFLGGTIGNLDPGQRQEFLNDLVAQMGPGDHLLLGTDLVKDPDRLEAAYNDSLGVTVEFNKNVLAVLNRRLGANFDLDEFDHKAIWDDSNALIDISLVSRSDQTVHIKGLGLDVDFVDGESIQTEISSKFTRARLESELAKAGLELVSWYTDSANDFGLSLSRPAD